MSPGPAGDQSQDPSVPAAGSAIGGARANAIDAEHRPLPGSLIALLAALGAMGPLTVDMYLPALPQIGRDLAGDAGAAQSSLATYFAGLAVGQLLAGPLSDRFGRMRPLLAGLFLYVVGGIGCALAGGVDQLAAWRFIQALGGAAAMVVPRAVIRDHQTGNHAARTASLLSLVGGTAPVVAPVLGGVLLGWSGWRSIFVVLVVVGIVLLLLVPRLLPRRAVHPDQSPPRMAGLPGQGLGPNLRALFGDRTFLAFACGSGCASAAMFAYITGSSFVIITLHGVAPAHFGWFFAINVAAIIGAAQVNRVLLRHWPLLAVLRGAAWLGAGSAVLLLLAAGSGVGGLWTLVAAAFLTIHAMGYIGTNAMVLALEHHGPRAGMAAALMGATGFAIAAVGSSLVSALHNGSAMPMAGVMAGGIGLAAAILLVATRARRV